MKVSEALARARKRKGLSQAELAKKLGVSAGTVGSWEAGDHGPSKNRIAEVAKVLDMDITELLA
jgi:transcriptional regulator with XRE-family HTH domain